MRGHTAIPLDKSLEMRLRINLAAIKAELKKPGGGEAITKYWATVLTLSWVRWVSPLDGLPDDALDKVKETLNKLLDALSDDDYNRSMKASEEFIEYNLGKKQMRGNTEDSEYPS